MSDPSDFEVALGAAGKVLPSVVDLLGRLIALGHSGDDAADIVKKDLESRAAEYEAAKAEDMKALEDKHAVDR